jgi:hypothetical protein
MKRLYLFIHRHGSPSDKAAIAADNLLFLPNRAEIMLLKSSVGEPRGVGKRASGLVCMDLEAETHGEWRGVATCVVSDKSYLLDGPKTDVTLEMNRIATRAGVRALSGADLSRTCSLSLSPSRPPSLRLSLCP